MIIRMGFIISYIYFMKINILKNILLFNGNINVSSLYNVAEVLIEF